MRALRMMVVGMMLTAAAPLLAAETEIRVLSYNVKGLPWPLVKDRGQYKQIGQILAEKRAQGVAPHVVTIQEGFRSEVEELVKISGYPYVFRGPSTREKAPNDISRGSGKITNSGIWILSEYPFIAKDKRPFRRGSCAGSDCYANKSMMFVRVQVPGAPEPMEIFNTHMNAKGSTAGVSQEKVDAIQLQQLMEIDNFMNEVTNRNLPAVFAADFNLRKAYNGFKYLQPMLRMKNSGQHCLENLGSECDIDASTDPLTLVELTADQHLFKSGKKMKVTPIFAVRNFRETLPSGRPLSDHLGYEMHYRLSW